MAGVLTIAADGSVAPGSKLTIDMGNLKSDQDQRDGYVKNRLLEPTIARLMSVDDKIE